MSLSPVMLGRFQPPKGQKGQAMFLTVCKSAILCGTLSAQALWANTPEQPWVQAFSDDLGVACQPGTAALPAWDKLERLGMAPEWALICGDKRVVSVTLAADPAQSLSRLQRPLLAAFLAERGVSLFLLDQSRGTMISLTPQPPAGMAMALVAPPELPQVLFMGQPDPAWLPYAHRGGDFDAGASYSDQSLHLRVGPDNGTATAGLTSVAPVVWLPEPDSGLIRRLTFTLASDQADGAQFTLMAPEVAGQEDWPAHDLMIRISSENGGPPLVALYLDEGRKGQVPLEGLEDPSSLVLDLDEKGLAVLRDASGLWLAETMLPPEMGLQGWHLQASARPGTHQGKAAMDLAMITSQSLRAPVSNPPTALPAAFAPPGTALQTTLFDASRIGPWMEPFTIRNLPFAESASLADGMLAISVGESRNHANAGLFSPEPLIWLDRFTDTANTRLRIEIDPDFTSGLRVALIPDKVLDGGDPGNGSYVVTLVKTAEGGLQLGRLPGNATDLPTLEFADMADMPKVLELVLRPGMIDVIADGAALETGLAWPTLRDGRALRLIVTSHTAKPNLPATLGLRRIDLIREIGPVLSDQDQAPSGFAPLDRQVLMAPGRLAGWTVVTPASPEMAKEVSLDGNGLTVKTSARFDTAAAGAITTDPVVILDDRLDLAGQRIALRFDPASTSGLHVQLADSAKADLNKDQSLLVALIKQDEGRNAGTWQLQLYGGYYANWTRPLTAADMALWDGKLFIDVTDTTVRVTLPGITALEAQGFSSLRRGTRHHLSVLSFAGHRYGPAQLRLTDVTIGTVAPPLMDLGTRLLLEPNESFDADAYLDWLATQMTKDGP
ncbi:hypothetical protein EGN72_06695 [Pseudorhodobacter sp. E13]|nr:hypothetical protein EGN72_06695 [Pseudorhodobacter sp. E13]